MTLTEKVFAVIAVLVIVSKVADIMYYRRVARRYREMARKDRERFAKWFPDEALHD